MIEEKLYARLVEAVGSNVFPIRAPDNQSGAWATYARISTTPLSVMSGVETAEVIRFQIDTWAPSFEAAKEMANAIRASISGHSDRENGWQSTTFAASHDLLDTSTSPVLYRVTADYMVGASVT